MFSSVTMKNVPSVPLVGGKFQLKSVPITCKVEEEDQRERLQRSNKPVDDRNKAVHPELRLRIHARVLGATREMSRTAETFCITH